MKILRLSNDTNYIMYKSITLGLGEAIAQQYGAATSIEVIFINTHSQIGRRGVDNYCAVICTREQSNTMFRPISQKHFIAT